MPLKLDRILKDADRPEFERLVAHPGTTAADAARWLRERGYVVSDHVVSAYLLRHRPGGPRNHRACKMDRLPPADRAAAQAMVANGATIDEVHGHMKAQGHDLSRVAVYNAIKHWRPDVAEIRKCARIAVSLSAVADKGSTDTHHRGALLGLDQVVLQQVYRLRQEEKLGAKELTDWANMLERVIQVRDQLEQIHRKAERTRDRSGRGPGGIVNGVEIANTVRRILGVPLPGEPIPGLPAPVHSDEPEEPP